MARQNYAFAKRQRDLAKKQKKEEKRQRKADAKKASTQEIPPQPVQPVAEEAAAEGSSEPQPAP